MDLHPNDGRPASPALAWRQPAASGPFQPGAAVPAPALPALWIQPPSLQGGSGGETERPHPWRGHHRGAPRHQPSAEIKPALSESRHFGTAAQRRWG